MGISQKEKVNTFVIDQLQDQLTRGKEGFGIVFIDKQNKIEVRRATELTKVMVDLYMKESNLILLHHRYPTSTKNKINQTHPLEIKDGSLKHDYLVVHNGVIRNDEELKEKHEALGFVYQTQVTTITGTYESIDFNDSEAVAIEVARLLDGQEKDIEVEGTMAFIAIKINKETGKAMSIHFARNEGNPLKLSKSRGVMTLSSEGKGDDIKPFTLYNLDIKTLDLKKQKLIIKEPEVEELKEPDTKDIEIHKIPFKTLKNIKEEEEEEKESDTTPHYVGNHDRSDQYVGNYKEDQPYEDRVSEAREEIDQKVESFLQFFDFEQNLFTDLSSDATALARDILEILMETQKECEQIWLEDAIPEEGDEGIKT